MKRLDRYIILRFLGTFLFIIALLMTISVVFDFSEKIDDFMKSKPTVQQVVVDYYINFILYYGNLFSPLIIFIALIFFTSRMAQRTEIVAILAGGVSFNRLLRPFFVAATLLVISSLILNHFIIPEANKTRVAFEEEYYKKRNVNRDKDIHMEVRPGTIVYFYNVRVEDNTGTRFSLEKWDKGDLKFKLLSTRAEQDEQTGVWTIYDYRIREYGDQEIIRSGARLDTLLGFDIKELGKSKQFVSSMNYFELEEFLQKEKLTGTDKMPFYLIEKHQRTSYPIATYVLTLIGVSVASRKTRGGIGVQIAIGFLIVLLYIFAMKVTTVSATNAGLDPLLATWIPNVLFGVVAIYLYRRAPK
ncbi:MAG: YjgP/YjgQ family permease [Flavobacteriales bacterium]|nr:YjgP/YjgQ family permease [Flavobacteriales bacterium]